MSPFEKNPKLVSHTNLKWTKPSVNAESFKSCQIISLIDKTFKFFQSSFLCLPLLHNVQVGIQKLSLNFNIKILSPSWHTENNIAVEVHFKGTVAPA